MRAVKSVLGQTFQSFRIVIVGDGVSPEHGALIAQLCTEDSRIQFVANPKGTGHGEAHRARVLEDSRATYVCYLGDDDLWLTHPLETLVPFLEKYDFVHMLHSEVATDGTLSANAGRIYRKKIKNFFTHVEPHQLTANGKRQGKALARRGSYVCYQ
ncbi:glycosyltransferase family 2 protein [Porticoccus sp.]|uniref:glycosyltransferase family 2 protein n=1 Tax=Porticoccus sp. TaxID=2024853 RepID=UPI003F6A26A4